MLVNTAVLSRELMDRLRAGQTIASILACAFFSSLLVWMRWPTDSRLDVISQGAMQVFRPLAYALAAIVVLLVPAFPATALVRERRRGTLLLLLNSPLSRIEIYLGKLLSNFLLAAIIISVSLPAIIACFAMGGLSIWQHVVPLIAVLLTMAIQFSAVGLWISSRASNIDASLRWTYAAILALVVLTLAPVAIIGKVANWQGTMAMLLTNLSPAGALRSITGSQSATSQLNLSDNWINYVIAGLASSLVAAIATLNNLNPLRFERPRPTGIISQDRKTVSRWFRRMSYVIDPNARKPGIPFWLNPVMVKEFRTRKFGRLHWLIRLVALCGIVSLLLTVVAATGTVSWGVERIASSLVLLQIALLLVIGPSLASGLIASELETGGWELLRMSPISTWRILIGKLQSVVWTMALILLATLPGYAVMMWIQPSIAVQVQRVLISLVLSLVLIVAISSMISAFWSNAASATATSYGVLLGLFVGTLLFWLARGKPFGHVIVQRILTMNPAAAALAEIRTPGFEEFNLTPFSWWIGLGVSGFCFVILAVRTWRLTRPD